jgi:hypothetical protein
MRHDPLEIQHAKPNGRTRRVWYGHGSSRLISENPRDLPPASVIDEAIAGFERVDTPAESLAQPAENWQPLKSSLTANLVAQLGELERQRQQLEKLLRNIDNVANSK